MTISGNTIKTNESIKRYENHLAEKYDRELRKVVKAFENCRHCQNHQERYLCLYEQGLSHRQIGVAVGLSQQRISAILKKVKDIKC